MLKSIVLSSLGAGLILGMSLGLSSDVSAATATSTMPVSATVTADCSVNATQGLAFGSIAMPMSSPADASSTIQISCAVTPSLQSLNFGLGQNYNQKNDYINIRSLKRTGGGTSQNDFLAYGLFLNPDRTGSQVTTGDVTPTGTSFTIYGRIWAQSAFPGDYQDSIIVTLNYNF